MFRKVIVVYSENHKKPINTVCGHIAEELNGTAGSACS
jgi:hypothetical protein